MIYYTPEQYPFSNKYYIALTKPFYDIVKVMLDGSFHTLQCRLFGFSPADYNRYIIRQYNATCIGERSKYQYAFYENKEDATNLCKELNRRANIVFGKNGEKTLNINHKESEFKYERKNES